MAPRLYFLDVCPCLFHSACHTPLHILCNIADPSLLLNLSIESVLVYQLLQGIVQTLELTANSSVLHWTVSVIASNRLRLTYKLVPTYAFIRCICLQIRICECVCLHITYISLGPSNWHQRHCMTFCGDASVLGWASLTHNTCWIFLWLNEHFMSDIPSGTLLKLDFALC